MASEYHYQLTQKATEDLDEIIRYIAVELANPSAASHFLDTLQSTIEETCAFPESGSRVFNKFPANSEVRKKTVGNYILYYLPRFDLKTIFVLRIVYGRRSMDEILGELNL